MDGSVFGGEEQREIIGRWESEKQVIKERSRRASELLNSSIGNSSGTSPLHV